MLLSSLTAVTVNCCNLKRAVTDISLFIVIVTTLPLMLLILPPTAKTFVPSVHLSNSYPATSVEAVKTISEPLSNVASSVSDPPTDTVILPFSALFVNE